MLRAALDVERAAVGERLPPAGEVIVPAGLVPHLLLAEEGAARVLRHALNSGAREVEAATAGRGVHAHLGDADEARAPRARHHRGVVVVELGRGPGVSVRIERAGSFTLYGDPAVVNLN